MNKIDILRDQDSFEEMGAVGRFDDFSDEKAFAKAVCGEILEAEDYIDPKEVEVKYIRMNPAPSNLRADFKQIVAFGHKGQRGSYKAYMIDFDR
jgi:hypothetical protein